MKRLAALALCFSLFVAANSWGQSAGSGQPQTTQVTQADTQPTVSPDVWLYQQYMSHYNDRSFILRKKAEFQAWQRMLRIESRQWFGFCNSRPIVSPDPIHSGDFAARWTSGSINYPNRWSLPRFGGVFFLTR